MQIPFFSSRADSLPVKTQIVAVTVYPNQARVTRRGNIEVTEQSTILEIAGLPGCLQPGSLQIHPRGAAQVTLWTPAIEVVELVDSESSESSAIELVHQLEEGFRDCKDRIAALQLQKSFLETLAERSPDALAQGVSQQSTSLDNVAEVLQFFDTAYYQVAEAIAQQERLKHDIDLQLQAARQQAQQAQSQQLTQYRLLLPIQVEQVGSLELDVVYITSQAQWEQTYNVRLAKDQRTLQIDRIAQVRQSTGESWEGVQLKVTTAVPEKQPDIPKTDLWRVHASQKSDKSDLREATASGIRSRSTILEDTYRMLGAVPGSEIPPSSSDDEEKSDSTLSKANAIVCFAAMESVTVATNDLPHPILVGQLCLDNQFNYVALPQLSNAPYLQAQLVNPLEEPPLLPGTAHLFRFGGYIGQEHLDYVAPGQSFLMSLGLDERILVQRELVTKETQAGSPCRNLRSYRLTLQNPFEAAIDMTVIEQVPTSQIEDIQINLLETDPDISASQPGYYKWAIRLEPAETRQIHYQYAVEHPEDLPISGLDA